MDSWVIDNAMAKLADIVRNNSSCRHEWGEIKEHPMHSSHPIYYQECKRCGLINPIGKK